MKSPTTFSPKGESTRERILVRAKEVFLGQGYDALVLRRIAQDLEMKLSNVQYYFPTKEYLLTAIIETEERYDIEVLRESLNKYEDGVEIVRDVVPKFLRHWRGKSRAIYIAREFFALNKPSIKLTKNETDAVFYHEIEKLLTKLNPDLSKAEAQSRRRLVGSLIDGAALHPDPGSLHKFIRSIENLIIDIATAKAVPA